MKAGLETATYIHTDDNVATQTTERVRKLRYEWRSWIDTIDIINLIFINETGINLAMTRLYGRGEGGARVYRTHLRSF